MKLSPIKKKRVYQEIIKQIKIAIEKGEIKPGDKLPSERSLADTFSVSRTSVKEAISVLDSSGIVDIRPGIGIFLHTRKQEDTIVKINFIINDSFDLLELIELRQAIEGDSAYYAALRGDAEDKKRIEEAFQELQRAVEDNRLAAEEDYAFHLAISRAAKNSLITKVMYLISDQLFEGVEKSRSNTLNVLGRTQIVLEEHRRIYEVIMEGKAEEARLAMWDHIEAAKHRFF